MSVFKLGLEVTHKRIYVLIRDQDGRVLARTATPTDSSAGLQTLAMQMHDVSTALVYECGLTWDEINGIGAAFPGSSAQERPGLIPWLNPLEGQKSAEAILKEYFGRPVAMGTDSHCGTLAEYCYGAGSLSNTAIGIFINQGLGGGLILNGQLHAGSAGLAGALGHMIVKHHGRRCSCGNHGCLEAYCSKRAFSRRLHHLINIKGEESLLTQLAGDDFSQLHSRTLAKAYHRGDRPVRRTIQEGAYMLGLGCANLCQLINPDCLIFGGSLIDAIGIEMIPFIRRGFEEHFGSQAARTIRLELSMLGKDAPALGATILTEMNLS